MAQRTCICVGTVGQRIWQSSDGGEHWSRVADGISFETEMRAFAVHPLRPEVIFAGTDRGLYRSDNAGASWTWIESPVDIFHNTLPVEPDTAMWCLGARPADPNLVLVCSLYGYLHRSTDGGNSWTKLRREYSEVRAVTWLPA